jgi:hypothetical protein
MCCFSIPFSGSMITADDGSSDWPPTTMLCPFSELVICTESLVSTVSVEFVPLVV